MIVNIMSSRINIFLLAVTLMAAVTLADSCSVRSAGNDEAATTDSCTCVCGGECSAAPAGDGDHSCHGASEGCVRHVILWTLSEDLSSEQKLEVISVAEAAMNKFVEEIPGLLKADVIYDGRLDSSNCDFMFDMYFESRQALEDFSVNPEHLAVVARLKPSITGRTCLDVEL